MPKVNEDRKKKLEDSSSSDSGPDDVRSFLNHFHKFIYRFQKYPSCFQLLFKNDIYNRSLFM